MNFYNSEETFIRSSYCRLLLSKEIYIICNKYKFICSRVTRFRNLLADLKYWPLVLSTWPYCNCRENCFHTKKCYCMFLNVGLDLPICEWNEHAFPCLIWNLDWFCNCSSSMNSQTLVSSKIFFSLYAFSLHLGRDSKLAL